MAATTEVSKKSEIYAVDTKSSEVWYEISGDLYKHIKTQMLRDLFSIEAKNEEPNATLKAITLPMGAFCPDHSATDDSKKEQQQQQGVFTVKMNGNVTVNVSKPFKSGALKLVKDGQDVKSIKYKGNLKYYYHVKLEMVDKEIGLIFDKIFV